MLYLLLKYQYKSQIVYCHVTVFGEIMKISKDERADIRNMPVGMSKKVYKEMVKEMEKNALWEEPSQQQRASNVICNH